MEGQGKEVSKMPVAKRVGEHKAGSRRLRPQCADALRSVVAEAWAFRWKVELEAEIRFGRLSRRLAALGAPKLLVELSQRASEDERRHAGLCREVAHEYGYAATEAVQENEVPEIAPRQLSERERVLYELVASCCITETESMSVLTTLLHAARGARMKGVLQEIARDEVSHSRLGWAFLASEHSSANVQFLGTLVPDMLEGTVTEGLFAVASPLFEDPELLQHGVLPHSTKRDIFIQTLQDVVFPGLEFHGIDTGPSRAWLAGKTTSLPPRS
jgi:hypothetical protein